MQLHSGHVMLPGAEINCHPSKLSPQSGLRRQAASRLALPQISSLFYSCLSCTSVVVYIYCLFVSDLVWVAVWTCIWHGATSPNRFRNDSFQAFPDARFWWKYWQEQVHGSFRWLYFMLQEMLSFVCLLNLNMVLLRMCNARYSAIIIFHQPSTVIVRLFGIKVTKSCCVCFVSQVAGQKRLRTMWAQI